MASEDTAKMVQIKQLDISGFKKVIKGIDSESGLECYIAIHNSALGPALGGLRIYPYESEEAALEDVLNLARAMTYKAAVAEVGLGGGKSVIIAHSKDKTPAMLRSFAAVVDSLEGEYIVAEDIGSTIEDMDLIHKYTPYVAATALDTSSGDPSRFTAWGVYRGMQAVGQYLWKSPVLKGRRVLIQGLGSVGHKLARLLFWEGAELIFAERDEARLDKMAKRYGAEIVPVDQVIETPCDIFAPCALGGVLSNETVPKLRCQVVAGSANNQLTELAIADRLMERGILYAPDFIINAGGLINAAQEFEPGGYDPRKARARVDNIYDILIEIFRRSKREHKATSHIAGDIADYNLAHGIGQRTLPITFF